MEYRKLGTSDLDVSVIGFGCWGIAGGSMWGDQDERESIAALQAALDAGITFFDTAEGYGDGYSEEVIGKALAARRDEIIIASKVSPNHLAAADLRASCEASLSRLRTDRLDLYQIHWPEPPGDADEVARTLEKLRDEGKIRYAGVSNFGPRDLDRYPEGLFVSNQLAYSIAFRAIEFHLVEPTVRRGMGLITYSSLLHGILTGKFRSAADVPIGRGRTRHFSSTRADVRHSEAGHEDALFSLIDAVSGIGAEADLSVRETAMLWVLARPGVSTLLAGSRTAEHARSNAAVADRSLDSSLVARLNAASEALKAAMGPNPDMWQTTSRAHW